jgi:NADH:ubiquinone oxidoreductase subunit 4 (subunit M)
MVQKCAYGDVSVAIQKMTTNKPAQAVLIVLIIIVFVTGVYPQPLFDLTKDTLLELFVK